MLYLEKLIDKQPASHAPSHTPLQLKKGGGGKEGSARRNLKGATKSSFICHLHLLSASIFVVAWGGDVEIHIAITFYGNDIDLHMAMASSCVFKRKFIINEISVASLDVWFHIQQIIKIVNSGNEL